jgi:hypothetical protein
MKFFVYNNEIDTKEVIKKSMYWREKIKIAIEEDLVTLFINQFLIEKMKLLNMKH